MSRFGKAFLPAVLVLTMSGIATAQTANSPVVVFENGHWFSEGAFADRNRVYVIDGQLYFPA